MQQYDVLVQVVFRLAQYPLPEVQEVKLITRQIVLLQPLHVVLKVGVHLLRVEDPVYHVATK